MTPQEMIASYARRDIRIYAAGGRVHIGGCRDALTPDDLELIRQYRDALTAYLINRSTGSTGSEFTLQSVTVESEDSAAAALAELGYRVRYLRDPEAASKALTEVLNAGHRLLGLDLETMPKPAFATHPKGGLDAYLSDIRLAQVATPDGTVLVFDHQHIPVNLLEPLMGHNWTAHNAAFEWRFLKAAGLSPQTPHCTRLMSRVATGQLLPLAKACKQALGIEVGKALQTSNWRQTELSPAQLSYAALDSVLTLKLAKHYADVINSSKQATAYRIFQEALPVVAQHMLDGMPFNAEEHRRQMAGWMAELEPLQEELRGLLGGINPDSGPQLGEWLRQNLEPSVLANWPTTEKGRLKTDVDAFQHAPALPIIEPLKRYKLLRKRLSTYGDGYGRFVHPVTGRIHADYLIGGARSGRFRCRNPNLQNAPRDTTFRSLFAAPEGYRLVVADYSQVELRIAALIAQDRTMLEAYEQGQDLHRKTAAAMAGIDITQVTKDQRQTAKACIAAGQLVLTDHGLIPIEQVQLNHRVWDGEEWVFHDGVVLQGFREVVTYDGLTATPDHFVFLTDGRKVSFEEVIRDRLSLAIGEIEGHAVLDRETGVLRNAGRTDTNGKGQRAVQKKPVFDILNAGPRHRFTVSGKVVANCNFGLIYGMGANGLATYTNSSYGVPMTLEQATASRNTYFRTYPRIKSWHARTKAHGAVDPTVRTQSGLIRDFGQEPHGFMLTEALNTPVQGSGAECLLRSLALLPRHLAGLDAKLIHHVHDEVILEVAEGHVEAAKRALADAMTEGFLAVFPGACVRGLVEAHDGKNWAEAKN